MKWIVVRWIISSFEFENKEDLQLITQLSETYSFELVHELETLKFEGWNKIAIFILMFLPISSQQKTQEIIRIISVHS